MRKVNLIPMAGAGQRFIDAGYKIPKPLIEIDGVPMVIRAANSLPSADYWIFVCREEHIIQHRIDEKLKKYFPNSDIISINYLTEGQASTCMLAREFLLSDDLLTIGACDNSMEYDQNKFESHISNSDALIWTFKNNPTVMKNPKMYGWVKATISGKATRVSCKEPISTNPIQDHAIIGAFTFRKAKYFLQAVDSMIAKNRRINGEFYMDIAMDECIKLFENVSAMEVANYICWGTPADLDLYNKK